MSFVDSAEKMFGNRVLVIFVLFFLLSFGISSVVASSPQEDEVDSTGPSAMDGYRELSEEAKARVSDDVFLALEESETVGVIVRMDDEATPEAVAHTVDIIDQESVRHTFSSFKGFSATVNEDDLERLEGQENVKKVSYDHPVITHLEDSTEIVNATSVWDLQVDGTDMKGKDQTVCVIDTGVDYSHPDLGGEWGEKVIAGYNTYTEQESLSDEEECEDCMDYDGHGTHVAGITASGGELQGVAPDAKIAAVNVMDGGMESDIIDGIDWCVNNFEDLNISIISMSLGIVDGEENEILNDTYCDDGWPGFRDSINEAVSKNISVSISTGNSGSFTEVGVPACIENATRVGGTDKNDEVVTDWNRWDKDMLVAPGSSINSTYLNDNYGYMSGTSMAAPHVSGVVAIMNQYLSSEDRQENVSYIEDVLNQTGRRVEDNHRNYTRIDTYSAVEYLADGWVSFDVLVGDVEAGQEALIEVTGAEDEDGNDLEGEHAADITIENSSSDLVYTNQTDLDFTGGEAQYETGESLNISDEYVAEVEIDGISQEDSFGVYSSDAHSFDVQVNNIVPGNSPWVDILNAVDEYENDLGGYYTVNITIEDSNGTEEYSNPEEDLFFTEGHAQYEADPINDEGLYYFYVQIDGAEESDDFEVEDYDEDNIPVIEDTDFIDGDIFRVDEVEEKEYNFTIYNPMEEEGINPGSIQIEVSYRDNIHNFEYDDIHPRNGDGGGIHYLDTGDDWREYYGIDENPQDGDEIDFEVYAESDGNLHNTETFTIHADGAPPYFEDHFPVSEAYTNDENQLITVDIFDNVSSVDESSILVSLTGMGGTGSEEEYIADGNTTHNAIEWSDDTLEIDPSEDGNIEFSNEVVLVEVTASDTVGHTGSTAWWFTVDTEPPENLTLDYPQYGVQRMGDEELMVSYSYNETAGDLPGMPHNTTITLYDGEGNNKTYFFDDTDYGGDNEQKVVTLELDNPNETTHEGGMKHDTFYDIEIISYDKAGNMDSITTEGTDLDGILHIFNMRFEKRFPEVYSEGDRVKVIIYDPPKSRDSSKVNQIPSSHFDEELYIKSTEGDDSEHIQLAETGTDTGRFVGNIEEEYIDKYHPPEDEDLNLTVLIGDTGDEPGEPSRLLVEEADKLQIEYSNFTGVTEAVVDDSPPTGLGIISPSEIIYRTSEGEGKTDFEISYGYNEMGGGLFHTNVTLINETEYTFSETYPVVNNYQGDINIGDVSNTHIFDLNNTGLVEGLHDVELEVEDVGGNKASTSGSNLVIIDNTPPNATPVDPKFGIADPVDNREVQINITDNNPLTQDLDFKLHYNITRVTDDGREHHRYDEISLENLTGYDEESIVFNASIDETGTDHGDEIIYWVEGTDLAGNPVDGGSFEEPLNSYYVDEEPPQAPPEDHTNMYSYECGVDMSWKHAYDCITENGVYLCGSGIEKYMIFRDGVNVNNVSHVGPTGYDVQVGDANAEDQTYFDYIGHGTYNYSICSVDKMGQTDENRSCTNLREATSQLSEITFDYYHDFEMVYEYDDHIFSNRTINIKVSDSCDQIEAFRGNVSEHGNLIKNEDVDLELISPEEWAYINKNSATTDQDAMYDVRLSAVLGYMEVDITSNLSAPTERYGEEYGEMVEDTHSFNLEEHTIDLDQGWSPISLPILPNETDADTIFDGIEDKVEAVWYYNTSTGNWSVYNPDKQENQLTEMEADKGYWINVNEPVSLTVVGTLAEIQSAPPEEEGDLLPDKIGLQDGFNLIGFRRWMNITKYFDKFGIEEVITYGKISGDEGVYYTKDNITDLEMGKGYWAEVDEDINVTAAELRELS